MHERTSNHEACRRELLTGDAIIHIADLASSYGLLNSRSRLILTHLGCEMASGHSLTDKQMADLDRLLAEAFEAGVADLDCGAKDCQECREIRALALLGDQIRKKR